MKKQKSLITKKGFFGIITLFAVLILQVSITTEFVYSQQTNFSLSKRDELFAGHFLDERNGFLVGNRGLLLRTNDGGETWQKVGVDSIVDSLEDITFIGQYGWIVGERGLILHTTDGGQHWPKQVSNSSDSLMSVHFLDQKKGLAVGQGGTILSTEDGGKSWETFPLDWMSILPPEIQAMGVLAPNLYDIFFVDDVHGWIVGEQGAVLFTSDGGSHWVLLSIGRYPFLYSVYFKDQFEGFAVGAGGALLHTRDGGKIWEQLKVPSEVDKLSLFKIAMRGPDGVVVGDRGIVLGSKDGGKTWDKMVLPMQPPLPWFLCAHIFSQNSPTQVLIAGQGTITKAILQ